MWEILWNKEKKYDCKGSSESVKIEKVVYIYILPFSVQCNSDDLEQDEDAVHSTPPDQTTPAACDVNRLKFSISAILDLSDTPDPGKVGSFGSSRTLSLVIVLPIICSAFACDQRNL